MSRLGSETALREIVRGDHGDPFSVLGMHIGEGASLVVRAFLPNATQVCVLDANDGEPVADLRRLDDDGVFVGDVPGRTGKFPYRLLVDGRIVDDPYRFGPVLTQDDLRRLSDGTHPEPYGVLGAHVAGPEGVTGVAFAVWAPNARRVSVVGAFNGWDGRINPMRFRHEAGVWEIFLPGVEPGALYKFEIKSRRGGSLPLKADPYGFEAENPPGTASVVARPPVAGWDDADWSDMRAARNALSAPISIYEVHLGSWRRRDDEDGRYLTYGELADELVPYVRDMGFTHIELLPITEHPFDGSWGYQPIGLYAPTSRFGTPDDFRALIARCHREGLGVIADWVPGHFPSDPHGVGLFDGTHLYEHEDPRMGRHMDWDTLIYNFGRREVANFLVGNARYWIEEFHLDGLRVDAVASMLYLDYSRKPGEWVPNRFGGNENLEAIDFLRGMNETVYGLDRGAITVAEESTAWPMVSRPTYVGGLGFGYKWNMGWMHDTLKYMSEDPVHRQYHHDKLTFGLLYAFSENFVLPLSHDEVVHGKGSLLAKMPGDDWQRFANLRLYLAFMFAYPGKKLLFMGGEFAQKREWNHDRGLDWHVLSDPMHQGVQRLVRDLNRFYVSTPALHLLDCDPAGFEWIDCNDSPNSVISFIRRGSEPGELALAVCNFTPVVREGYRIGVPERGTYVERLNSDSVDYGGSGVRNGGLVVSEDTPMHGRSFSVELTLPPLSTVLFTWTGAESQGR